MQKLKSFFVYFLWSESKVCIKDGPSTLFCFLSFSGSLSEACFLFLPRCWVCVWVRFAFLFFI